MPDRMRRAARLSHSIAGADPAGRPDARRACSRGRCAIPVVLGRGGIRANKREGDGATPRGRFRLVRLWWRADRGPAAARPAAGPAHHPRRRLVRGSRRPALQPARSGARPDEPGDRLWRDDHLYDLIIEIDHNTRPRIAGRGSAVFVHLARPNSVADGGLRGAAGRRPATAAESQGCGPRTRDRHSAVAAPDG